jgi:RNA polymerase sigma factor (sigma-70 family)
VTVHRMSWAVPTIFGMKGLSGVSRRPQVVPKHCQGTSSLQTLEAVKSVSSKYVGYIAGLMAWLVRIGPWSREDAEDLIQDGMLRLLEYRLTAEVRNEQALLNCIVKRLAANKLTQRRRVIFEQKSVEEQADHLDLEDPYADPHRRVAVQQRLEIIQRLLDAYSPRNGAIYFAHRAGHTHREIAEAFAIDESTVEKHIARAVYRLMNLKERL